MLSKLFSSMRDFIFIDKAEIIEHDESIYKKSAHKIICTAG